MCVHKQRSCFGDRRYGIVASRQAPLHLCKGDYIGWLRNTSDRIRPAPCLRVSNLVHTISSHTLPQEYSR